MTSGVVVTRPAVESDGQGIWPLMQEFAVSYRPQAEAFGVSFSALLQRSDTLVLVAEDATGIIGYLLASFHGTFFANGPVAWVEELMVAQPARRSGVGRSLLAHAERWAQSVPTAYIALASRRAGDFYRRVDYEESATYYRKLLP
jgi:GNAT superfamily N-acetyltransferase